MVTVEKVRVTRVFVGGMQRWRYVALCPWNSGHHSLRYASHAEAKAAGQEHAADCRDAQ